MAGRSLAAVTVAPALSRSPLASPAGSPLRHGHRPYRRSSTLCSPCTWSERQCAHQSLRALDRLRSWPPLAAVHRARHGFECQSDLWRSGRHRLQRPLRLHLLPPRCSCSISSAASNGVRCDRATSIPRMTGRTCSNRSWPVTGSATFAATSAPMPPFGAQSALQKLENGQRPIDQGAQGRDRGAGSGAAGTEAPTGGIGTGGAFSIPTAAHRAYHPDCTARESVGDLHGT